jgi:two-component system sensor histidine kinase BaeS
MTNRGQTSIATRLAAACVAIALLAVLIVLGLAIALGSHDIDAMITERRVSLTETLHSNAAATYNTGSPGWSDADLQPALDIATRNGTSAAILDTHGKIVASTIPHPLAAPDAQRTPITVDHRRVGTLVVQFNGRGLVASADRLRSSLEHAVVGAAGIAALLALAAALVLARRLSHPMSRLTLAATSMSHGDRAARVGTVAGAPRELHDLATAFDEMADAVDKHEQLRRDLVADTAHELRTPIAVLQANCEALIDGVVPQSGDQLESLHEEVLRLAGLVDDLQSLASADAAGLTLKRVPCDLAALTDVALDALAATFAAAELTVTRRLQVAIVDGDPVRLHQVITNVLTNAVKFTPPGGHIDVQLGHVGGSAELRVTDDGVGIPAADQPRIFDRFWRGSNAESTPGSGVGLAIVSELIRAHRGDVRVQSESETGTTVVLSLPLADPVSV